VQANGQLLQVVVPPGCFPGGSFFVDTPAVGGAPGLAQPAWIDQTTRGVQVKTNGSSSGWGRQFPSSDQALDWMFSRGCANWNPLGGCCGPSGFCAPGRKKQQYDSPLDPRHRRWAFAKDHLAKWLNVYRAMGLEPPVYLLNASRRYGDKVMGADPDSMFAEKPGGSTPMTQCMLRALSDHQLETTHTPERTLLLLVLTDGEADDMDSFNALLDSIQNGKYGDVQVCLVGLSLVPEDIEWFENEECDDTRIRTVEAYEVEQQQMLRQEVIKREGDYNFDMHVYRTLVTNLFPADYDYEAPVQNLRHRLYATCHSKDRWWMQRSIGHQTAINPYSRGGCGMYCMASQLVGALLCTPLYLASGGCCLGYCQGQECCKCRSTECMECFGGDD